MGSIISSIQEIDGIRWTKLRKGRPQKVKRALQITDAAVLLEFDNGKFTIVGRHHDPDGNWAVLGYGLDKFEKTVLDGLVRMSMLTKEQVENHIASVSAGREKRERAKAKEFLVAVCAKLGIPVPEVPDDPA